MSRVTGFAARLILAQALVLGAGALTTWVVASAVGPSIFHEHLLRAGDSHSAAETRHIEEAFGSALLLSVTVALIASVAAALGVSWFFSRRVQRSIDTVAQAAEEIAAGRFGTRVPPPGLGHEFDTLAEDYNALATRLEAVETTRRRMLADLAHEMRTPLATIDAHLEAVEDGVRDLDPPTMAVLRSSTGRLRRLAQDVTAVSRAEEGNLDINRQLLDTTVLVGSVAETARDRFSAGDVQLHTDLAGPAVTWADPDRIGQVLTNLLDNALRHSSPDGQVQVTCLREGAWVRIEVSDTGDGIPPEHLAHVFDRFYRVDTARDRNHGGSGIGLAIVKAIAEAHGGTVRASSPGPGHGATFTVRLPAAQ